MSWEDRWAHWDEKQLRVAVDNDNENRFDRYSRCILTHIRPTSTLDIGGGTGGLGGWLPGKYAVMDHPRMEQFLQEGTRFIPIDVETSVGRIPDEGFDLVVGTNSFAEMTLPTIGAYFDQIKALKIPYLFIVARRQRYGLWFDQYPLDDWEVIVKRPWQQKRFVEFLGRLKG